MNLIYFHTAELQQSYLIAMTTVFPKQLGSTVTHIVARNICAKYELKML